MKKIIILCLALAILTGIVFATQKAFAGAWTTPKNHMWIELGNKYSFANDKFLRSGERVPLGRDDVFGINKEAEWWAYDFEVKTEYGLADWLDSIFNIGYEVATYKEKNRPTSWGPYTKRDDGIKYISLGLKARATQTPMVVSYQLLGTISTPTGFKTEPQITTGDHRIEGRILIGKSYKLGRLPAYSGFETGYRVRMGHKVADDIPLFFETGIVLLDHIMVQGEIDSWIGLDGTGSHSENLCTVRGGVIFSPTGKFNQLRGSNSSLNIAVQGGYNLAGKNSNAGYEIIVKVSAQFDVLKFVEKVGTAHHINSREPVTPTNASRNI